MILVAYRIIGYISFITQIIILNDNLCGEADIIAKKRGLYGK